MSGARAAPVGIATGSAPALGVARVAIRTAIVVTTATIATPASPPTTRDPDIDRRRARAAAPAEAPTAAPHSVQKRAPAGSWALQRGHCLPRREVPQAGQNFPTAAAPHAGHREADVLESSIRMIDERTGVPKRGVGLATRQTSPSTRCARSRTRSSQDARSPRPRKSNESRTRANGSGTAIRSM